MSVKQALREHHFFAGMAERQLNELVDCGWIANFQSQQYLIKQNGEANRFFLLLSGHVTLKTAVPQFGEQTLETLGPNEALGWSWLVPPYRWHYDAQALEPTTAAVFDGECLRAAMEDDHELGYRIQAKVIQAMAHRLQAARLQGMDIYATPRGRALP